MRYSELVGKEIIDLDEGVRLGVVASSDLVIDTETGQLQAMIIIQRAGWMATREIVIPWPGIKRVGRDMIIVDMSEANQSTRKEAPERRTPSAQAWRPVARHRVPGVGAEQEEAPEETATLSPVEEEAPQLTLSRMARGASDEHVPFWRRASRYRPM